jgi:hypothetical protein
MALGAASGTAAATAATATTSQAEELLWGAVTHGGSNLTIDETVGGSNGYSLVQEHEGGSLDVPISVEDQTVAAVGTYTASWTLGTSVAWACHVATFQVPDPSVGLPSTDPAPRGGLHWDWFPWDRPRWLRRDPDRPRWMAGTVAKVREAVTSARVATPAPLPPPAPVGPRGAGRPPDNPWIDPAVSRPVERPAPVVDAILARAAAPVAVVVPRVQDGEDEWLLGLVDHEDL